MSEHVFVVVLFGKAALVCKEVVTSRRGEVAEGCGVQVASFITSP